MEKYLELDGENITCQQLDDDTLVDLVTPTTNQEPADETEECDNDPEPEPVSLKEAKTSLNVLLTYLEQQGDSKHLNNILDIKKHLQQQTTVSQKCVTDFFKIIDDRS